MFMRMFLAGARWAARTALAALLVCGAARAETQQDLYRARTIVTGQGEANRLAGFAACLDDVVVKLSGLLRLAGDPRLARYKAEAASLVREYSYRDEKGGKPKNDEQGTRDRSFVLTADFDEARVNGILDSLGVKPWLSPRPVLGVFVRMDPGAKRFLVASDSIQTELHKQALRAAAAKRGISVMIPDTAALAGVTVDDVEFSTPSYPKLAAVTAAGGANAVLISRLNWDDRALRWNTRWQLEWQGHAHRWRFAAATFDEAFRLGIGGATQAIVGQLDRAAPHHGKL